MLVLTRKQKEEIHIGNNVTITILRIKGQSVRIGITAPKDVRVIRGELQVDVPETDGPAKEEPRARLASSCSGSTEDAPCRSATDRDSGPTHDRRLAPSVQPTNTTLMQMARHHARRFRQN